MAASTNEDLMERSSLGILGPKSLKILGDMLNVRRTLLTEDGLLRDYRGLAKEAGLNATEIRRAEASAGGMDPTR